MLKCQRWPYASCMPHVLWSQTKVLSTRMFFILFLKLQSTWTYPLLLFSKFSSRFSTAVVDSFLIYPEYLLNSALFSVVCEFLLLGISPDLLCACCNFGWMIFLWLHIGMVSCIILFSKSVEWLSGSCLCLYEKYILLLYITPLAELQLFTVISYTARGVTANYCYTLHCYKSHVLFLLYITFF